MGMKMARFQRLVSVYGVALAVGFAPAFAAAAGKRVEKAESRVEVAPTGSSGRIVNRTFEAIVEGDSRMLLRKEIQSTFDAEYEQGPGRVRIDAWRLPRSQGDSAIYTISDAGDEIGWLFFPELLAVRIHACCASSGSRTVFNASTGKTLLYANGEGEKGHLAMVTRGGRVTVLIGVHDDHGGREPRAFPAHRDRHMSLLVTAADPTTCRRQVLFDIPWLSKLDTYVEAVNWDKVKAWRVSGLQVDLAHGEILDGVLKILVSDKRTILLPVIEQGIDASRIVLPTDVKMKELSECVL
jgi:hypothetical protein